MDDSFEHIKATGEWWINPWWEDRQYYEDGSYNKEDVNIAISILKKYFDRDWVKKKINEKPLHGVLKYLCYMKGTDALSSIRNLGLMLKRVEDANGFVSKLKELKSNNWECFNFEYTVADIFARNGYEISFPKGSKWKMPDIEANGKGDEIAIECKLLRSEQWELWENSLLTNISHEALGRYKSNDYAIQVELNPRLSDLSMDDPDINDAIISGVTEKIVSNLPTLDKLEGAESIINIDEICNIKIIKSKDADSYVSGMHISDPAKIRRILKNALFEALGQLPTEKTGIIALLTNYLPNQQLLKIVFDSLITKFPDKYSKLNAVIIFPYRNIMHYESPILFINRQSENDVQESNWYSILIKELKPIVI